MAEGTAIQAKVQLDGGTAFKNEMKASAAAIKATNAELAYYQAELKKSGTNEEALKGKTNALSKAWQQEQQAIDLLNAQIEKLNQNTEQDSTEAINKLTTELYKHKAAQAALGDSVDDSSQDFTEFADKVAKAQVIMSAIKDVVVAAAKEIWNVGKGAVQYNMQMESYEKTIEAFFKTSGQGSEEAAKNTKQLIANQKELSVQTGMASDKLIEANKMLIAAGMAGEDSQKAIDGLAKAIVATGGGSEELGRMAQNLQQIANTGKASSQDMKQFAMAGVDLYGLMADSTGKTVDELKDMDITFDMIVEALTQATAEGGRFFEASQVGASTLQGQMSLLESTIQTGLGTAFEPVNEALREKLIPAAIQLIEDIDWNAIGNAITFAVNCVTEFVNAVDEFRNWYNEVYGEKPQETIDAFAATQEELNDAFMRTGGNIKIFDSEMAGAVEAVKGHGNHMAMEFDGMQQSVVSSVQETAGQVKDILVDQGWEMMAQGETNGYKLAEGIAKGDIPVTSAAKQVSDDALAAIDRAKEAEQYGLDFVSGFATGMHKNSGLLATMASKLAGIVAEYLHFSRPDVGPLRDYETWMPDFVSGLARTMEDSEWMLADASQDLAQTINNNTVTNNITMTVNGAAGQNVNDLANVVMLKIQQATERKSAVWA